MKTCLLTRHSKLRKIILVSINYCSKFIKCLNLRQLQLSTKSREPKKKAKFNCACISAFGYLIVSSLFSHYPLDRSYLSIISRARIGRINTGDEDRPRKRAKLADSDGAAQEFNLTVTEPFNLLVDQRAQIRASLKRQRDEFGYESEYIPLASRIKKFQDKTPERWKRDPRPRSPPYQPRLTHPEPFVFHTEQRVRGERINHQTESHDEVRDEDDVWPKPLTEPVSPHLRVDRRANREHVMDMSEHERPVFNFPRYIAVRYCSP